MIIKIDYREKNLISLCSTLIEKYPNISLIQENLPIADIIILDNNDKELILIERKTLNDLAASIKDGRYKEQSFRLNETEIHNHNIIYLIEGNLSTYKSNHNISKNILHSSMISINLIKGFSLFKTNNINESAEYIVLMADKIYRELYGNSNTLYYNTLNFTGGNSDTNNDYASTLKKTKKEHINQDNISTIMLSQIPGVSTNIANAIMDKYKSLNLLIFELENDSTILNSITILDKNNKNRKISKTACNNIVKYLINKD